MAWARSWSKVSLGDVFRGRLLPIRATRHGFQEWLAERPTLALIAAKRFNLPLGTSGLAVA
jgi:hypothetical protein